jgi:cytochrome P450
MRSSARASASTRRAGTAASVRVEDVDLGSFEFWSQPAEAREPYFAVLRRDAPVSHHPAPEDVLGLGERDERGYWAVVRYDDVRAVSRDPETFCSAQGVQFADAPQEMLEASQSFLAMDAPRHTKLRGLVQKAFGPRQVARIEDGIRANARRVVEEAAPSGGGDFVELIAKRLPLITFSEMLGVPEADRERVVEAADDLITAADEELHPGREPLEILAQGLMTLHEFATATAADRASDPRDDLMTALVQAEIEGERLTQPEIAAFFVLLAVAGNDTTRHTTSHAMRALTNNPGQREILAGDLEECMPTAVEEFVRWATPVMTFRRTTTRPVELHGKEIGEGEKVVLFYSSANRDEAAFEEPDRFDVTRDPNRHAGFGGGGPHYCLGASLARSQLRSLFTELLTLLPDLEVGEPEILPSPFINAVKRMECSFTPRA